MGAFALDVSRTGSGNHMLNPTIILMKGRLTMIDRSEVNRALAKAIAYKQCNKQAEAEAWARRLIELLELAEILR